MAVNGGRSGVYQVLSAMKRLADSQSVTPPLVAFARSLVHSLPQKDRLGEIGAVFSFVQNSVRYVRDPVGAEWLQAPLATLELRAGDCDDKSILLASLLNAIGYQTRFRAVGAVPGRIGHVLVDVANGGDWIPLDTTEPYGVGWNPPASSDFELSEVSGLGFSVGSIGKKISGAIKKVSGGGVFSSLGKKLSVKKTLLKPVGSALDTVLRPLSPVVQPVVEKTIGTEEFRTYFPQAVKLIPVVGPAVGTAMQTAIAVDAAQNAAEALADQAAAEELAALEAEKAARLSTSSSAGSSLSSPFVLLGLAAVAALVAGYAAKGQSK